MEQLSVLDLGNPVSGDFHVIQSTVWISHCKYFHLVTQPGLELLQNDFQFLIFFPHSRIWCEDVRAIFPENGELRMPLFHLALAGTGEGVSLVLLAVAASRL